MKARDRYDVSELTEARFEQGSRGRVLRNLRGIVRKREMDRAEAQAQVQALEQLFREFGPEHRFCAEDIRHIHRLWLGTIYDWAGNYRRVNIGKGNILFAAAAHVPKLMDEFDTNILGPNTPCRGMDAKRLASALAVVHAELILIHPFRDGNGRVARLLAILMAAQAGFPPLDFSAVKGSKRSEYYAAVRAAFDKDYAPMERFFAAVFRSTCRRAGAAELIDSPDLRVEGQLGADARPQSPSKRPRKRRRTANEELDR